MKFILTLLALLTMTGVVAAGDIKLPSGRVLKNAQVGPMAYTNGNPSSLVLKYETSEDIDSKEALSKEVADIWASFRLEVEKGKYPSAIIMVNGPADNPSGIVKHRQQRNFVFTQKDGTWHMLLPSIWQDKKEQPKPTPTPPA